MKEWPETHAEIFKPLLTLVSTMTLTIEEFDSAIAENAQEKYPEIKRLMQIPGVGPITLGGAMCAIHHE